MFLFAIAHYCYYPWEEWEEGYRSKVNNDAPKFTDNFAIGDFANDVKNVISSSQMNMQSRKFAKNNNFDLVPEEGRDTSLNDVKMEIL